MNGVFEGFILKPPTVNYVYDVLKTNQMLTFIFVFFPLKFEEVFFWQLGQFSKILAENPDWMLLHLGIYHKNSSVLEDWSGRSVKLSYRNHFVWSSKSLNIFYNLLSLVVWNSYGFNFLQIISILFLWKMKLFILLIHRHACTSLSTRSILFSGTYFFVCMYVHKEKVGSKKGVVWEAWNHIEYN